MVFKDYLNTAYEKLRDAYNIAFEKLREAYRKKPALTIAGGFVLVLLLGTILLTGGDNVTSDISTAVVKSGPLRISVTESGTIQPKEKIIVKNEVEGQTSIVYIVDEGARVKKGDLLVELDSSTLTDNRVDQEIKVLSAEAAFIDARESYSVAQNQAESDVDEAKLAYEFAGQDLDKYVNGEYPNKLKEAEATITLAEETLAEAQETVEWSKKLHEDQFISASELEKDQLSYKKKALDLDLAKRALDLLVNYTHKRDMAQLESDVKQAKMALERTERKAKADVVQAEANLKAKEAEYSRQQDKLKKIETQLDKTKIYAPADGSVIYATSSEQGHRFGPRTEPLDIGSNVQERQELIHLPTENGYMVQLSVAEASIDKVKVGLPVLVTVETLPGNLFTGRVKFVSTVVNAQDAFMNPDLKVYDTQVVLDDSKNLNLLRSGMSCTAEIVVAQYEEATYIPVQAVLNVDGKQTVYMVKGDKLTPRSVETGADNSIVITIAEGLKPGETVSLNPPLAAGTVVEQSFEQLTDVAAVSLPQADAAETGNRDARQGSSPAAGEGSQARDSGRSGRTGSGFSPEEFLKRADTDGDGRISASEFQGPSNFFSRIDKNGDGYISEDEFPKGPPGGGQISGSGFPSGGQMMQGAPGNQGGQMPGFGPGGGAQ